MAGYRSIGSKAGGFMSFGGLIQTFQGRNELAKAELGEPFQFTEIWLGDGSFSGSFMTKERLEHAVMQLPISSMKQKEEKVILESDFHSKSAPQAFYFREIGIFANGKLCFYDNSGTDAEYIDPESSQIVKQKRLRFILSISSDIQVTVNLAEGLYALEDELVQHTEDNIVHITEEERENWNEEIGEKEITFSQATDRENLTSEEKLKISLGKIKKYFSDLKAIAFSGSYNDLSNKPTIPAAVRVKGEEEEEYHTGDINLTPENIGAMKSITFNIAVDFNTLIDPGIYIMNAEANINAPTNKAGVLFVYFYQGKTWQSYFVHGTTKSIHVDMRYCERFQWMSWLEASIEGDSANNTVSFTSADTASPTSWTNVSVLTSGEKHSSIFNKISTMFKNLRYLYKILGTTSISSIGNGTVTGAISTINNNLSNWETLTISETYSGFKYTGGLMKYHPILKLAFISVTIQATAATTTGVKIDMCKFSKIPSVNTALSARSPNTAGQAVNVAVFTDGTLSLSTEKAIPKDGYILCSGIYSFT